MYKYNVRYRTEVPYRVLKIEDRREGKRNRKIGQGGRGHRIYMDQIDEGAQHTGKDTRSVDSRMRGR